MTFGSLFAGIGGLDLGLERAGFECKWQVEIDPFCRKVLTKHWPNVPKHGDIRELTGAELERVDVIAGGFPCQPVSLAGKRLAQSDDRWLWPEFARLIRTLRPAFVLLENVAGLLSAGMGRVLGDLAASGYDAEWDCIPAAAVGAPHLRYRVFVIAHAHRDEHKSRSHAERGPATTNVLADSDGSRLAQWSCFGGNAREELAATKRSHSHRGGIWATEPDVGRVADGIPARVDRLRGLGNAVVPQVAEYIGRRILAHDPPRTEVIDRNSSL